MTFTNRKMKTPMMRSLEDKIFDLVMAGGEKVFWHWQTTRTICIILLKYIIVGFHTHKDTESFGSLILLLLHENTISLGMSV